jgi:serine/threonine protein kinase
MALASGTRLGSYEIQSALGAGGMGEVYRARDTKLGRDVALKILPALFAADPERLARFEREAQVLASLNHPNIAAIHGVEDSGAIKALVLEFVDGPTLADRLARGALPLDEVLESARQIADALEAAHERGIIHRDLKPANIKLREPAGATSDVLTVKVLDFGLAKLAGPSEAGHYTDMTASPTLTMQATFAGTILGTAAYMSPEQAKGKSVDRRADIWAFGVVLWEMLTGRRMYEGETAPEILARVIEREPDLSALPASTPDSIRFLLARCLTKDPRRRLQAIGEARIVVERAIAEPAATGGSASNASVSLGDSPAWRRAVPWAVAGALLLALAAILVQFPQSQSAPASRPFRMSVELGADVALNVPGPPSANLALSSDGELLAFVAEKRDSGIQLYIRRLEQLQATPLAGTTEARNPFFSPDGQWIAFFADGKLKKISVAGGAAVTLCDAPSGRGGSWAEDGTIAFTPNGTPGTMLLRVSAAGGKPEPLIRLAENEQLQRWPQFLTGGRAVLFTSGNPGNFDEANIAVQRLPDGERKVVQRGAYFGRYVSSGHLIYIQGGTLFAVPFSLDRLEVTGQPIRPWKA